MSKDLQFINNERQDEKKLIQRVGNKKQVMIKEIRQ